MNNRKSKTTENNENLCPITRKRIKPTATLNTPQSSWKVAKIETASSPSELTVEYLKEMGIGILDSEESSCSSSVASAIALTVNAGADENSNEVTPNLDAPIFRHKRVMCRSIDITLDNSIDNVSSSLVDPNDTFKGPLTDNVHCNISNNNYSENSSDEIQQKKVAGFVTGSASIIAGTNSISNSPSRGRITRSPLAAVVCNSHFKNNNFPHTQQVVNFEALIGHTNINSTYINEALLQNSQQFFSFPSTSQQAALRKRKTLQTHIQKQQEDEQRCSVFNENFFVYRNLRVNKSSCENTDYFNKLSDEIILQIFKWLPKKALMRCSYVSQRFNRCASDESLWTRLDLGGRTLRAGALGDILFRGIVIFRLAQAELNHPVFQFNFLQTEPKFDLKLQYLDLSMVSITKPSLKMLLSRCRQLKKLSLEHVPINDEICNEIAKNANLEALNVAMCVGLEAWSVRNMLESLKNLNSLNISWTNLTVDAVTSLVTNITPNLLRLNAAGCRRTMFDSHLSSLCKRCPQLLELDLSDCTALTGNAIAIICKFKMLEYLSLSRCYLIPASSYVELKALSTLTYLDIFGMLSDSAMEMLERYFPALGINKFIHSSVARPTVGTRRTSIWGLRTRD